MPRKKSDELSPSEWKIMKIVWERKSCATRDICAAAKEIMDWSPSTVKTLLRRMVEKGFLKYEQIGNSFLYHPARSPLKSFLQAADELLENAVDGMTAPIVAHMVKKGKLSEEEIEQLQDLLKKHSPERK